MGSFLEAYNDSKKVRFEADKSLNEPKTWNVHLFHSSPPGRGRQLLFQVDQIRHLKHKTNKQYSKNLSLLQLSADTHPAPQRFMSVL